MKVYVPQLNKQGIGGGNTFVANFRKHTSLELTDESRRTEVMFVPNPMWAERADFEESKKVGRKIVLRLDNIPEDWNNRGTAISKLKDFILMSDVLVFQSEWSKGKYWEFMEANNLMRPGRALLMVIHNGVDTEMYTPSGENISDPSYPKILYVKSSRNENKRYPEAMEIFRRYWYQNQKSKLYLVGQFADDIRQYNFGFYNGENYQYLGMQANEMMPTIYRSADVLLFPAYADCAPNTVLEAMACGVVPVIHSYGGAIEYMERIRSFPNLPKNYDEEFYLGWLSDRGSSSGDYTAMINSSLGIDRQAIREHVVKNFDIRDCVKKYEEVIRG